MSMIDTIGTIGAYVFICTLILVLFGFILSIIGFNIPTSIGGILTCIGLIGMMLVLLSEIM